MTMSAGALTAGGTLRSPSGSSRVILRGAGVIAGAGLFGLAFRQVDVMRVAGLIHGLGVSAVLIAAPSMAALTLETIAWRSAFSLVGERVAFWALLRVRVASESVGALLPLGALWSEALKPALLARHCETPVSANLVGIASRKYLLLLSQAGYLFLGFALGRGVLLSGFHRLGGSRALVVVPLVAALVLGLLSEVMAASLGGGRAFRAVLRTLSTVPSEPWRAGLARWSREIARSDGTAARFFGTPLAGRIARALPCLGAWLFEATETWLMLRLLGFRLEWGDAVGVEALVMLARNVLVFLPGGLGAQELGYATFLGAAGADMSVCAAFMVLKRTRELCWVVIGGLLLAMDSIRGGRDRAAIRTPHAAALLAAASTGPVR